MSSSGISTRPTGAPSRRRSRAAPSSPSTPTADDPDPSPLLGNIVGSLRHRARIPQPMVRAGWLDRGPGAGRAPRRRAVRAGELGDGDRPPVAGAPPRLRRARRRGRLRRLLRLGERRPLPPRAEPAPSLPQLPRAASCAGEHSYSNGALTVIMPHVVGDMRGYLDRATAWSVIERHTELFVCFGGIPLKNTMVSPGGASRHPLAGPPPRGEGPRGRVRAAEPDARRPARVPRGRVAPGRAGHRRRRDARPRPRPGRRGALRPRVPRALLRGIRPLRALPPRRGGRLGQDPRVGRAALRDPGRDDPRRWRAGWPRSGRSSTRTGRSSASSTASRRPGWS